MTEIQGHKSNEIRALNQTRYERPFFIIETAGEPRNRQLKGTMSLARANLPNWPP
jgi:hypothetical protein